MLVRFGFVAMSMLLQNASPSRTMTYTNFVKLADRGAALRKLERLAEENLQHTLRVMKHAVAHEIYVYRLSSKLIPLATHDELKDWDPFVVLEASFEQLGSFANQHNMRISFHPDHFCVLNTPREQVLLKSIEDLEYHIRMLDAMKLEQTARCNIHVGGAYGSRALSGERFIRQFSGLEPRYQRRITLENDDKTFTAEETLVIAEAAGVPMVLDIHHHAVNDGGVTSDKLAAELWPRIAATWQRAGLPPKLHASSPRSAKDPRSHADNIEPLSLLRFLQSIAGTVPQIDIMLEAKRKDAALLQLMDELRALEKSEASIRVVDGASIEVISN